MPSIHLRLCAIAAVAVTWAVIGPSIALATQTFPGLNGPLVYTRIVDDGCSRLFTVDPDGTDHRAITPECDWELPAFSPGGRRLVAVRYPSALVAMDPDGSDRRRLRGVKGTLDPPVWSPDGRKIAYERFIEDRERTRIYVMRADGSHAKEIDRRIVTWVDATRLAWSPDSKKLLYVKDRVGRGSDLYVARVDRPRITRLTDNRRYEHAPDWSPDGDAVIFAGRGDIFSLRIGGKSWGRRVTDSPNRDEAYPAYSPNGSLIAFESEGRESDRTHIAVIRRNGRDRTRVSARSMNASVPVWAPDGTEIAMQVFKEHSGSPASDGRRTSSSSSRYPNGVYVVDLNTQEIRRLFRGFLLYDDLDWGRAP